MNFERLPVVYRPPFDCVNDNANCPICKRRQANHGVCGSVATFIVRTEHEGKQHAAALCVLGGDFLPVTRAWWYATRRHDGSATPHHGASLGIHHEDPDGPACDYLDEGRGCVTDASYFIGEALFAEHGDSDCTHDIREQPEALWLALERRLIEAILGKSGAA